MKVKPIKLINVLVILSLMLGFVQTIPVMAKEITPQAGTTIGFSPATAAATTCEAIEVNVVVNDVEALTGYHLEMTFDQTKLQVVDVENGGLLYDGEDRVGLYEPVLDKGNTTGRLIWGMAQRGVGGDPSPVTGSGSLLKITLKALATSGSDTLEIDADKTMLVDWPDAFEIDYDVVGSATISLASCAPTAIALDNSTVAENLAVPALVGNLSATDPDTGDTSFTYSLVDSVAYPDNAAFSIVGNKLNTKAVFNYEVKNSYSIKIRATDAHGAFFEKVFTITVTDVNDAPVIDPIEPQSVANTGTLTIEPTASDEDVPAATLEWSLGGGTASGATIDPATGAFSWTPGTTTPPGPYTAIICVTDGDATTCETVEITVTDGVSPIMENVSPARGNVYLADGESFVLIVDADDDNLYSLEIDHSFGPPGHQVGDLLYLPEFTVYADKDNPWGDPASATWAATLGVGLNYDEDEQIWTIDFGEDITEDYFIPNGVTFYLVLHDEEGNTWGSMSPTTPDNTYAYSLIRDDVAPVMEEVTPERGNVYLAAGENFVLTVDASDTNLYSLEIDHSMAEAPYNLPEFTVYADKDDPYGGNKAAFDTAKVTVLYDDLSQKWTIGFGSDLTNTFINNPAGIKFYMVLEDMAGNKWGSMYDVQPFNTFAYKLIRDDVAPKLISVTPSHNSTVLLGIGDTFKLTIKAEDDNLRELEIDHSMAEAPYKLPEFSVYASESDPYGGDEAIFAANDVTVTYDVGSQTWVIDFGPTVSGLIAQNGGITFYMVLKDMAGNTWGTMSSPTAENTFKYIVSQDLEGPELEFVTPDPSEEVLLGVGKNFVWTVDAKDGSNNLYSLEIDHSLEGTLPEFTVYADAGNVYGSTEAAAAFAAKGVSVTYNATTQAWTIDFGAAVTKAIADNGGITFYVVLKDTAGNKWGSMDPVTTENTFEYIVSQDLVSPTISSVVAKGATGYPDVTAIDTTLTVDEGYKVSTIEITMSEPVKVALGTQVTINPQGAVYGTVTAVNGAVITVTPAVGNETASVVGDFTFTVPTGSVEDLAGNAWLNVPITLVVQDATAPTIVSGKAIGAAGFDDVDMIGRTFTVPHGYTVEKIEFTMSEPVQIVAPGIVYHQGNPYGTMTVVGNVVTVTPYTGNEIATIPGTFTFTIDAGSILDMSGNALGTLTVTMEVESSPIFNITDFGPWGTIWPGAYNLGWGYVPFFDTTTIAKIEVGMLDADRKSIVSYTAEDEQIVWQRDNGYITADKLSSAPFYRVYKGNPLAEGTDLDWTVIFGESFDAWSPRWGYVRVTDAYGTVVYREIEYTGTLGDLTAPEIDEAVAVGVDPFVDVTADNLTFTVPQGYTVEKIEFTMSEAVTVVAGTEVTLGGVPYGSITADGTLITVTPYPGNTVANLIGTFVFNVPDGKIFDISGNPLGTLEATMIVINVAPVAVADTYTVAEDGVLTVGAPGVLSNDTDFDPTILTAVKVTDPTNGSLTLNANGGFTYTPDGNFTGTDTFTYKANDGLADSNEATVTITVTAVNDAPVAEDQTVTTAEDTAKAITLIATDADGDSLTYKVGDPANGTLSGIAPNLTYTPNANFNGSDSFTYTANDGTVDSNEATVSITVTAVNDAPVAVNDTYATSFEKPLTVDALNGVLKNDSDVDGDAITAILVTSVSNGTLTFNPNGSFVYTPIAGFSGVDAFTYQATDGVLNSNIATVSITVSAFANTPPVAVDDEYETDENVELVVAAPGVLVNDYDIDGDNLTATLKTNVTNGTLVLLEDGSFTYKPNANFCGTDSFTYTLVSYPKINAGDRIDDSAANITAGDDGWTADATVTITVYCDAKISSDNLAGPFYVGNLQEFQVRLENKAPGHVYGSLAASIFVDDITAADFSSVEVKHPLNPTSWVTLTPVVDGTGMRIDLGPIASIPLISGFDQTLSFRVNFNTPGKYPVTGTLYDGAIDPTKVIATYSDTMVVAGLLAQDFGYMYQSDVMGVSAGFGNVNFDLSQATEIKVELFAGSAPDYVLLQTNTAVDPDLMASWMQFSTPFDIFGSFDYTADGYWNNVRAAEYGQTAIPTRVLATITLPGGITLTAENTILTGDRGYILDTLDEEIASAPTYPYDPPYVPVGTSAFDPTNNTYTGTYTAPQVLAGGPMNDMARLLGALYRQSTSTITSIVYNGKTYTWDTTGTLTGSNWEDSTGKTLVSQVTDDFQAAIGTNTWDPDAGFVMTVHDDYAHSATVTFKLIILNTLDDELESAPGYVYTPVYTYVGSWAFADPTNIYTLTYADTNFAPGAMNDMARYLGALYRQSGSTVASIEYDGVVYTWRIIGDELKGSNWRDASGTTLMSVITADVIANEVDPDEGLILTLSDVFHTENVTFKLVVNDTIAPVLESVLPTKGSSLHFGPGENFVLTVDAKDDNLYSLEIDHSMESTLSEFTVYADVGNVYGSPEAATAFATAGVTVTYDELTQTWTIDFGAAVTKAFADNGGITFYMVLADESGNKWGSMSPTTAENTFAYTIAQDLVAPTVSGAIAIGATGFGNVEAVEMVITVDQGYTVAKTEVTMSEAVTVLDGTVVSLGTVPYGSITLDETGKILTVTPYPGNEVASKVGEFIFTISEGSVKDLKGNALETLSLKLIVLNVAPVAVDDVYTVNEDEILTVAASAGVLVNDTDYPGTTLIAELVSGPVNGTLTLNADGSFVYTPNANFNGTDSFTYQANDGDLSSTAATVTITVTAVNDVPVAQDQTVTTPEDTAKEITLLATDVDGDPLTYTVVVGPTNGTLSGTAPNLTYTPNANFNGTDSFTFKANDGTADSNTATVTINITPVNDTPVAVDDSYTMVEDGSLTIAAPGVLANDTDDGSSLTAVLVDDVSHGTLTLNANGSFTYIPNEHFNGKDSFTYKASDGELHSNLAVVEITVTPVNDWVIANDDAYETPSNVTLVVDAEDGILANDVLLDPNETVSIEIRRAPESGTLVMNNDGSFTYVPKQGFWGTVTFEYRVHSEQKAGEWYDDAIVTILVKPHGFIYLPIITNISPIK